MARGEMKKRLSAAFGGARRESSSESSSPSDVFLDVNDDEAERRERRKSKVPTSSDTMEPPMSPPVKITKVGKAQDIATRNGRHRPMLPPDTPSQLSQLKKTLNNDQLTDLYANCIKLCSENKINTKNTWDLNLIDYIDDVIEVQQENQEMMNFQIASVTLDASVKIYSCRVDSVHNETYKVLGGLSRTATGQEKEGENSEENENHHGEEGREGEENNQKKKRIKKITEVGGVNTLDSFENITAKKFDLAFDVDPLFKKTSASFDEGGAKGLLLNHLSVYHNCQIIFDSSDAIEDNHSRDEEAANKTCDVSDLQLRLKNSNVNVTNLEICPTFSHFSFSRPENADDDDDDLERLDTFDLEPFSDEDVPDFGPNDPGLGPDIPGNGGAEDLWQTAEANLMEEILSQADEDDENAKKFPERNAQATTPRRKSLEPPQFVTDNEFAYFDPKVLGNWAGPDHWKFTKTKNNVDENNGGAVEGEKKKGKKKDAFFIDFSADDVNVKEAFAGPGRAATTLSTANLKKASANNNLLPPDVHYDLKMLSQLFTKPNWRVSRKKRKLDNQKEDDNGEFSFIKKPPKNGGTVDDDDDNGGGFFGDAGGFDNHNDPANWSDQEEEGVFVIPPPDEIPAISEGMLEEPNIRKVEQIKINYAKTSKFVDVKALKDTIWKEVKENPKNNGGKESEEPQKFQDILERLPSRLPPSVLPNVSVPFAFICLLHLANEKGISLEQERNDIDNLIVKPPST